MRAPKLLIIGLDCAEPSLVFERWRGNMPHLSRLMEQGAYRRMRSCDPPITVPAWSVMMSGKSPGELGVYGFRNRGGTGYDEKYVADGRSIKEPRLWDRMTAAGKKSIVIGVPQTWPPKALDGYLVSGILTPSMDKTFTWPAHLSGYIRQNYPGYQTDIPGFRNRQPAELIRAIREMTLARFALAADLMRKRQWDFFMLMEIGLDRMHHAFWQHMDPNSAGFVADSPYKNAIRDYYTLLDTQIGLLLKKLPSDTWVLIVSDHGAQPMRGLFRLNQWLIDKDFLVLKNGFREGQALALSAVDWTKTRAWADGGYYGRIYFNVAGREAQGIVPSAEIQALKQEIRTLLAAVKRPGATKAQNRVLDPQEIYPRVRGLAPDLMIYMEDLALRVSASLGRALFIDENDTGPDGANHAFDGICISNRAVLPDKMRIDMLFPLVCRMMSV